MDRLIDYADVIDSLHSTPQYCINGYPMVRVVDINNSFLNLDKCIRVSEETMHIHNKNHIPQKGDVIITRVGSYGMVSYVDTDEPFCLGQNIAIIHPLSETLGKYIYYFIKSPYMQRLIHRNSGGSAYKCIGLDEIKNFPLMIQGVDFNNITSLLFTIDKKIDNNNKINVQLDFLAKTLYDYWFLQFEFPNEEGKPYKSSGGKMVWNEELKQEIPERWSVCTVDDFGDLNNGINYDKGVTGDKKYIIANIRDISATTLFLDPENMDEICLPSNMADKYLICNNDILIARSGIPGSVRIVDIEDDKNIIYCGFIICLSLNDERYREYLVYKLKDYENTSATTSGGTIMQNVSQDTLRQIKFAVPDEPTNALFKQIVDPIWKLISEKEKENDILVSLRDFLLPLLMNGQVGFKENSD